MYLIGAEQEGHITVTHSSYSGDVKDVEESSTRGRQQNQTDKDKSSEGVKGPGETKVRMRNQDDLRVSVTICVELPRRRGC